MILIHAYTPDGRYMGCRTVEQDNISDRRAVTQAFHSFAEIAWNGDLMATPTRDGYAVSLNLNLIVERKPCSQPESSLSSPS